MSFQNFINRIFPFKKAAKANKEQSGEVPTKTYSFIWYRQMQNKGETIYSQPFRTKITAASLEEAREKATNFALKKQILVVTTEEEFVKLDLHKLRGFFDGLSQQMNSLFDMLEKKNK